MQARNRTPTLLYAARCITSWAGYAAVAHTRLYPMQLRLRLAVERINDGSVRGCATRQCCGRVGLGNARAHTRLMADPAAPRSLADAPCIPWAPQAKVCIRVLDEDS